MNRYMTIGLVFWAGAGLFLALFWWFVISTVVGWVR